jgi:hypothetical protein
MLTRKEREHVLRLARKNLKEREREVEDIKAQIARLENELKEGK